VTVSRSPTNGSKRGVCIVIAGPDGVGKTTLRLALISGPLSDRRVRDGRGQITLPRRTEGPVTEPHRDDPYPAPLSAAKTLYYAVDYLIGWASKVRPWLRRGGWILNERGWWDMAVDPRRYRLRAQPRLVRSLGWLLPRPDLFLILEAPADLTFSRKDELPPTEIERQTRAWRRVVPGWQRRAYLDASLPVELISRLAEKEIERVFGKHGSEDAAES
jgi:thymidylate kinase